jgi:hypothetical protein
MECQWQSPKCNAQVSYEHLPTGKRVCEFHATHHRNPEEFIKIQSPEKENERSEQI